ncbi:MAG: YjzC family protein [Sphaerochaetaceae bacterium]|nr:YjzC family protein [Sphaerochaetaceae bacterium]
MAIGELYKTGQNSPAHAHYAWFKYTDGTRTPIPTDEEKYITLETEEKFPPINSQKKGAWWKMTSYA